jgi:hypothetical protein
MHVAMLVLCILHMKPAHTSVITAALAAAVASSTCTTYDSCSKHLLQPGRQPLLLLLLLNHSFLVQLHC